MSFNFKSIGHAFSAVANELVMIARKVRAAVDVVASHEAEIEALTALAYPKAVELERAAFFVFGEVAQALDKVGVAAAANGLNVQFDQEALTSLNALINEVKAELVKRGIIAVAQPGQPAKFAH